MVCDDLVGEVLELLKVAWGFWVIGLWSIVIGQLPGRKSKSQRTEEPNKLVSRVIFDWIVSRKAVGEALSI